MENRKELDENNEIDDIGEIEETEHILHMWEPFEFEVEQGYRYRNTSLLYRFLTSLLLTVVFLILSFFNAIVFGFRINGRENIRKVSGCGCVSVTNHVHPMDCTMIGIAMINHRMNYVTLESNFRIPVARHIIKWLGAVPLSSKAHEMKEMFSEMNCAIQDGECVQIYPETVMHPYYADGTRKFHDGAFRLAYDANAPILPMVFTFHERFGIFKLYKRKPLICLNALEPVYPDMSLGRREAIDKMRDVCKRQMNKYIAENK